MISLRSVEWRNFLGYGDYATLVDSLDSKGPVLITGAVEDSDRDSNGAGKSTIIAAIVWCLFDRTVELPRAGDHIINWYVGKDCYVEVKTTDGWTIRRTRKLAGHDDLLIYNDRDEDQTRGTNKEAEAFLHKHFDLDYDLFKSGSFFLQGKDQAFLDMSDPKRKKALERLMGIERLNIMAETAKGRLTKVEATVGNDRERLERMREDAERYATTIEENQGRSVEFQKTQEEKVATIATDIAATNLAIEVYDKEALAKQAEAWQAYEGVQSEFIDAEKALRERDSQVQSRKHKNELIKGSIDSYEGSLGRLPSEADVQGFREALSEYETKAAEIKGNRESRMSMESDRRDIQRERERLETEAKSHELKALGFVERIEGIIDPEDGKCATCGQPAPSVEIDRQKQVNSDKRATLTKEAEQEVEMTETKRGSISLLDQRLSEIDVELESDEWTEEATRAALQEIHPKHDALSISKIDGERSSITKTIEEKRLELTAGVEALSGLEIQVKGLRSDLVELASKIEATKPAVPKDELLAKWAGLEAALNKMETLERSLSEERGRDDPYARVAASEGERLASLNADIESKESVIGGLIREAVHLQYIYKAYSDRRKIKSLVLGELIPYLNDRVEYYLAAFNCDLTLRFTPSLGYTTDKWKFELYSGGEKKRVNVAIMFALHDLHIAMYGQQCNVMVLDEVDTALDEGGAEHFVSIIKNDFAEKRADRPTPDSILVISHRSDINSSFPERMRVVRDERRFSRLEVG